MANEIDMTQTNPPESAPGPRTAECPPQGKILIVDDERTIGELLSSALGSEGFDCRNCLHGREALSLLEQQTFDAVISDLRMPEISGLDLLLEVRRTHPHMAFLMVTATDDTQVGVQAMKDGADDYLVKPFQLENVLLSVNRALEKKGLERELEGHRRRLEQIVDQRSRQLRAAVMQTEQAYDDTLEALAAALDVRDIETAGHSRRVTGYCLEMARLLGCSEEEVRVITRGAYLHDIGKIGVPDAILLRPGKLTEAEHKIMETHVRIGYELVCRIAFLADAANVILAHHERYDGAGYPQGLVAEGIPLAARIFAVADTLDAMTSDRPYRRALPYAAARAEIIRESGRQFDPHVVEAFLSIPQSSFEAVRAGSLHPMTNRHATRSASPRLAEEVEIQRPLSMN